MPFGRRMFRRKRTFCRFRVAKRFRAKPIDTQSEFWYTESMQISHAKIVAVSAAANLAATETSPAKAHVSAAVSYLSGKTDRAAFSKKCAKNPMYVRLVVSHAQTQNDFGAEALCALHKTLFEPKSKCGEFRTGDLQLPGGSCTDAKLSRGSVKNALGKLALLSGAPETGKADFAANLCCYIRELIILSPFAFGNGVVRRAFIQSFCYARGFLLNYAAASKKELLGAENAAFAGDDPQPLYAWLQKSLSYAQEELPRKKRIAPSTPDKTRRELSPKLPREAEFTAVRKPPVKETPALKQTRPPEKAPAPPASPAPSVQIAQTPPAPAEPALAATVRTDTAAVVRELRELQKQLTALSARVGEILADLTDKK